MKYSIRPVSGFNHAFFDAQNGESAGIDGGFFINGEPSRNINLFSPGQKNTDGSFKPGFDEAQNVLGNINRCFAELGATEKTHKFFMTSYYANMAQDKPRIVSCENLGAVMALKEQARVNLDYHGTSPTERLGLDDTMREAIRGSDISVIKADALIFKGLPNDNIAVLGAAADAHPIMMFDPVNKIGCYLAGSHLALAKGVLQSAIDEMVRLGADAANIEVRMGPGLGPKSYEFSNVSPNDAPSVLNLPITSNAFSVVENGAKVLVNMTELVYEYAVHQKGINALDLSKIHNINIDTMGLDLYEDIDGQLVKAPIETRSLRDNRFYGARGQTMFFNLGREPGAYPNIGRNGNGFLIEATDDVSNGPSV